MAAPNRPSLISRDLQIYEAINSVSSITLVASIVGKVTASQLGAAIRQVQNIHPYLRMRIVPSRDARAGLRFMEAANPDVILRAETGDVSGQSWQARLNSAVCEPSSIELSVSRWLLISSPDGKQHQLVWTVNHAGTDGIGIFSILDDLLTELGQVSSGNQSLDRSSREFVDIIARVPTGAIDYPAPQLPKSYMPAMRVPEDMDANAPAHIVGTWYEFDESITARILDECNRRGCSFQGALSAAAATAMCQANVKRNDLPQDIVILAPVNMRPYVYPPLDNKDSVCGSAGLTWSQHVTQETTLWALVKDSTRGVAGALAEKQGLWWWASLSAGKPLPAPTIMCSSIGITPIKKTYGKLAVTNIKLLGGVYDKAKAGNAGIMTHAYTVNGRLNITFAYTSPPLSTPWAERFLATEVAVLEALADGSAGDKTITSTI